MASDRNIEKDSHGLIFHSNLYSVVGTSAIHCEYIPPHPQTVVDLFEPKPSYPCLDESFQLPSEFSNRYEDFIPQSDQLCDLEQDWICSILKEGQDSLSISSEYGNNSATISSTSQFEGDSTFLPISSSNAQIGLQESLPKFRQEASITPLCESNEVSTAWNRDEVEEEGEERSRTDVQIVKFIVKSNMENLYDGFSWRKYGEKNIKKRTFRRSYFKCGNDTCLVKKHVERSSENPADVWITYFGRHNHHSVTDFARNCDGW